MWQIYVTQAEIDRDNESLDVALCYQAKHRITPSLPLCAAQKELVDAAERTARATLSLPRKQDKDEPQTILGHFRCIDHILVDGTKLMYNFRLPDTATGIIFPPITMRNILRWQ